MMRKIFLLVTVFLAGNVLSAAAADIYTIDPDHTYPSLEMSHLGMSVWRGKFNKTTGKITLDRQARTGTVDIVVDTSSIDWGHDKMNEHSVGPNWLNVAKFPAMTYTGKIQFTGDTPSSVDGKLTLLGVTRPLTLKINNFACKPHPLKKTPVCGADAQGELHRADFGLTKYAEGEAGKIYLRIQVEAFKDS